MKPASPRNYCDGQMIFISKQCNLKTSVLNANTAIVEISYLKPNNFCLSSNFEFYAQNSAEITKRGASSRLIG